MNYVLSQTNKTSPGLSFHFHISKASSEGRSADFFTENGMADMIKASNIDSTDKISRFQGAIADNFSGLPKTEEIHIILNSYCDILRFTGREGQRSTWKYPKVESLKLSIFSFRRVAEAWLEK